MKKPLLSVVLATYNEQDNLPTCLQSIKSLADEIIVVDGGSTDNTRQIAKKMGAKVVTTNNFPIFHQNKQKAVVLATGTWILQLDADEEITPALSKEIKTIITKPSLKFKGYYLPRKNFFLTRFLTKGGQYPDYVIRLFLNGYGHFPCQSVHEQIAINGPVGYLTHPLLHWSDKSFRRYLMRFNRYTDLDAKKLARQHLKPGLLLAINYLLIKPNWWFLKTYFRHLGLVDGWPGFIFCLMSSLRFPVIYFKLWEKTHVKTSH